MHIAILVDPITSKIITSQAMADRLGDEGHEVTVLVPPGPLDESTLASLGLTVNLPDLGIDPPKRTAPALGAVDRFQSQLRSIGADLHLIDGEANEYVMAALAGGFPVGLLNLFFNLWKRPGVPPVHQNVVPGVGWRGHRLGVEYGWLGYRVHRLRDVLRSTVLRNDRRYHLRRLAERLGLEPSTLLTEFQGMIPFQYRQVPSVTLNLAELELPGGVHPLNHYVGPMPNRSTPGLTAGERERIVSEVEARKAANPGAALIYAAFGAYYGGDDLPFWRQAVQAVGQRTDWIGVFGLGGRVDPADLGPIPDNVLVYRWAPQLAILELADCAVIHAGMTSVYECLHHRVPMVVFPLGDSFDQFGTAARVAYHQLGAVGDRTTATGNQMTSMIDEVMADAGLRDRIETFRHHMDRYREERVVTAAVEAIAADPVNRGR